MIQKIIYSLVILILSGSTLYAIWIKEVKMPNINAQSILAVIGILAILFSLIKIFSPGIKFKIVSNYFTLDKHKKGLFILKLQTISNVNLTLEDVKINVTLENGKTIAMVPISVRWKGVFFKMHDINDNECDYKLLKPLDPDLRICGIKQGSNECYVSIKSTEIFEDKPIESWSFELQYRHHLLPIPNMPWFNRKTITVIHPEGKDLYFDDSLFKKISTDERTKLINEL